MAKHNQIGAVNALLLPLIISFLLLVGAIAFGAWAYGSRQDYKDNVDQKVSAAVTEAKQQEGILKDKQFTEAAKLPLATYKGPESYGSLLLKYPKSWSGYVLAAGSSSTPVNGYFYPGVVPSVNEASSSFALRVEVTSDSYDRVVSQFTSDAKQGKVTVVPFKAALVPSVVGVRLDGQISSQKTGTMVILPLRDKTLKLWTEAPQFKADFVNNILPNFSFSP